MSINLDIAEKINPFAGTKSPSLRRSVERVIKHQPGEHDQLTHGRTKGAKTDPSTNPVAAQPSKFDKSKWQGSSIQERKTMWGSLSEQQKDDMIDAPNVIKNSIADRLKYAGQRPTSNPPSRASAERIKQIGDLITPDAGKKIQKHMKALDGFLKASGVDNDLIRDILLDSVDALAVQENESLSRTLGDHGVRHVLGDAEMALKVLEKVPGFDSPQTKAATTIAAIFHDTGYLTEPSQMFLDGEHPRSSMQHYDANLKSKITEALGEGYSTLVGKMIATHADTTLDWENDPMVSALRLADNVALFHEEKMPGIIHHVPANKQVINDFADKKIDIPEAIKRMKANIESASLTKPVKDALNKAADEFSPVLVKNSLAQLAGKIKGFEWKDTAVVVKIKRDQENLKVQQVLDLGQKNFSKFAEAFKVDPVKFETDNRFEFTENGEVKMIVEVDKKLSKSIRDRVLLFMQKHGDGDQKPHGHRNSTFYHGTGADVIERIKKEGIQPPSLTGNSVAQAFGIDSEEDADRVSSVYLTPDRDKTIEYAIQAAKFHHATQTAIVEVDLPDEEYRTQDEYSQGSIRLAEIKPEWIKSVKLYDIDELEALTKADSGRETLYAVVIIKNGD